MTFSAHPRINDETAYTPYSTPAYNPDEMSLLPQWSQEKTPLYTDVWKRPSLYPNIANIGYMAYGADLYSGFWGKVTSKAKDFAGKAKTGATQATEKAKESASWTAGKTKEGWEWKGKEAAKHTFIPGYTMAWLVKEYGKPALDAMADAADHDQCRNAGGIWVNGECLPPGSTPESCAELGGVWQNNQCMPPPEVLAQIDAEQGLPKWVLPVGIGIGVLVLGAIGLTVVLAAR